MRDYRLTIIGLSLLFFSCANGGPLYTPGKLSDNFNGQTEAYPETNQTPNYWQVDTDVALYYFYDIPNREDINIAEDDIEETKILVLNDGPGFASMKPWDGFHAMFNQFAYYYYHRRGAGYSTHPLANTAADFNHNKTKNEELLYGVLGLGTQISDIEQIRRNLEIDKIILIGHGYGAFLAALYAAEFPEQTEALILVSPADFIKQNMTDALYIPLKSKINTDDKNDYQSVLDTYFDDNKFYSRTEEELSALYSELALIYQNSSVSESEDITSFYMNEKLTGGWNAEALKISLGDKHDYSAAFENIDMPTLILYGENDFQNGYSGFSEAIPTASIEMISNAGHFCFDEQPEDFAAIVSEFLKIY